MNKSLRVYMPENNFNMENNHRESLQTKKKSIFSYFFIVAFINHQWYTFAYIEV